VYARYLHPRPDGSGVGDDGEHLACAGFFPPAFSALVAPLFESIHRVCCGARERRLAEAFGAPGALHPGLARVQRGAQKGGGVGVTTDDAAEAQRRRERGAKALAARLEEKRRARERDAAAAREAGEAKDARGREDASAEEKGGSAGEGNAGEGGGSDEAV